MYAAIARYYDLTHATLTQDIPFVLQLAAQANGPVLELGCGSGRLLLPLLQAGYAVVGVDNSPEMLARARARLAQLPAAQRARARLVEADMRHLTLPEENGRFALVLLPYNTAMHLSAADLGQTLRGIREHLAENGRFLIDVANPLAVAATPNDRLLTLENVLPDAETGQVVAQFASNWLDDAAQTLRITWLYDASPPAGGAVHRTIAQFTYHYLYPHQWQMALSEVGLRLRQMLGDYEGNPFTEESGRLLLLGTV